MRALVEELSMLSKTVLVTGGAGHVGSHVIEQLLKKRHFRVISLDNYFTGKKQNHIKGAEYRTGHTKDIEKLIPEKIDIVYHLGEYARVTPSFKDSELVFEMNTLGTLAVLNFCQKKAVGKLVYAASSTKFADGGKGRHQNPYSFTKAMNVDLIRDFGDWYGLPYAICYFYNAFGPRENFDDKYGTVIAKFEQSYLNGRPITVVLPGTQKRNFTHVSDLARGIVLVGEKGKGDGYALNNRKAFSIIEIAKAFGCSIEYAEGYPGRIDPGDSPVKAREELGWETTVDVMDYIRDFIAQHPRHLN